MGSFEKRPFVRASWQFACLLLGPLFFFGSSCSMPSRKAKAPEHLQTIQTAEIKKSPERELIQLSASLEIGKTAVIRAPFSGTLSTLPATPPIRVLEGQELLALNPTQIELTLNVKRSELAALQAELAKVRAEEELEDTETLQIEEVQAAREAQSELTARKQELLENEIALLENQLEQSRVKAPFSGFLTSLQELALSQSVESGDSLYRLESSDPLLLRFSVPLEHAAYLKVGAPFTFTPHRDPSFIAKGTIASVSPTALNNDSFAVEAWVPNDRDALKAKQTGLISITTEKNVEILTIPQSAIVYPESKGVDSHTPHVFLVSDDHRVYLQKVKLGKVYGSAVEVRAGLNEGESIALSHLEFLIEGESVSISEAP